MPFCTFELNPDSIDLSENHDRNQIKQLLINLSTPIDSVICGEEVRVLLANNKGPHGTLDVIVGTELSELTATDSTNDLCLLTVTKDPIGDVDNYAAIVGPVFSEAKKVNLPLINTRIHVHEEKPSCSTSCKTSHCSILLLSCLSLLCSLSF